jgi:flagellar biosynthesis/type III secretory pathway protein FliH
MPMGGTAPLLELRAVSATRCFRRCTVITAKRLENTTETAQLIAALRRLEHLATLDYAAKRHALAHAAQRTRARARRAGHTAGYRAGLRAGEALADLEQRYAATVRSAQRDCLELCVSIAAEIVATDLAPETEILGRRIAHELNRLIDQRRITVRVGPHDHGALSAALATRAPARAFTLEADPHLNSGDAIIETPAGSVRLVWREQLALIRERLLEHIETLPIEPQGSDEPQRIAR